MPGPFGGFNSPPSGARGIAAITGGTIDLSPTGSGYASGTAANPSLQWSADSDGTGTGLYRRAQDVVTVASNGTGSWEVRSDYMALPAASILGWTSNLIANGLDAVMVRAATNSIRFGPAAATTTSRTELNKAVATISNAVATTVLTVTIPNAAHSASLEIRVTGSLGAGGAVGANEATATNTYVIGITRTAGVATVATATAAFGAVAVAVAGAATVTATAAVTAMSGAIGATQTFDVQVTISRSGGSSDNHTCLVYAKLMNANVTGITMA